ncbi:hypothetical protein REPUB_Repub15cG0033500 [Reevesia pubescens]
MINIGNRGSLGSDRVCARLLRTGPRLMSDILQRTKKKYRRVRPESDEEIANSVSAIDSEPSLVPPSNDHNSYRAKFAALNEVFNGDSGKGKNIASQGSTKVEISMTATQNKNGKSVHKESGTQRASKTGVFGASMQSIDGKSTASSVAFSKPKKSKDFAWRKKATSNATLKEDLIIFPHFLFQAGTSSSGSFNGLPLGSNMSPFGGGSNLTFGSKPQEPDTHPVSCIVSGVHESPHLFLTTSPRALPQQNPPSDMIIDSMRQVQDCQASGNDSSAISSIFLDKTSIIEVNDGSPVEPIGAGSLDFLRHVRELIRAHRVNILIIVEPRISGSNADRVIRKLKFDGVAKVDARGFSGGIWVLWKATVYASPTPSVRELFWNYLANLHTFDSLPWLLVGDFNQILSSSEKQGGRPEPLSRMRPFREVMAKCDLIDLEAKGCQFTWSNNHLLGSLIKKRLDRAICNSAWRHMFSDSFV